MCLLALVTILLSSLLVTIVYYANSDARMKSEVREETRFVRGAVELSGQDYLATVENTANRITLIDTDGTVLYDNQADPATMENHSDREEFQEASTAGAGEATRICILDTFVALMAGLIIIPACFAFGVEPGAGPGLVFITLPNVFNQMTGGKIWGALFFLFMSFAALSTVIAVFENILSFAMDLWGWKRNKAVLFNIVLIIILSMPAILGFGPWSGVQILGEGTNIMDLEDFIISNNILPLGSVIFVIFCASKNGWGWDNFIKEANTGKGIKFPTCIRNYMLWVIPVVVAIIYLKGYYDMFQPKGNTYLIPWMIVGIAMLILVGWIVFGHSKKNKK